jgi:drug/metabolite transporter (DMT)-like permease
MKVQRWWPFVLLLLVGASRWAVSAARPDADSTLTSQTLGCASATLLAFAFLLLKRNPPYPQPKPSSTASLRWFFAGALLSGGPAIGLLLPGRDLDSSALTIALALTPIIIAIASTALGTESSEGIAGRIWPSLAALAGLLLVLVQPNLGDLRADLLLLLAPVLTGLGAVLFCTDPSRSVPRTTTALLGACVLFALALATSRFLAAARPTFSLLAIACDGIVALLGIATLSRLGATRWSSQFTWVPLLIILEGIVLVRPKLTAHWFTGLILLIVAGVYLLLPPGDEATNETPPSPPFPFRNPGPLIPRTHLGSPLPSLQSTTLPALHSTQWQPRCISWSRAKTLATTST